MHVLLVLQLTCFLMITSKNIFVTILNILWPLIYTCNKKTAVKTNQHFI